MGNLIKYEWRKQRMTRILILACLLAFVVLFVAGAVLRNDTLVAVSILIMTFAGMFGILYVGIENIVILNRDLKTKQSYMLWMVPHSTYEILASKIIADGICVHGFLYSRSCYFDYYSSQRWKSWRISPGGKRIL